MPFRVTDTSTSATLAARVAASRARSLAAQERVVTGKRINRPSDDPAGAAAVIRLRDLQAAAEQSRRNGEHAHTSLLSSDAALENYQRMLDRVQNMLTQGASDTTTDASRAIIAQDIDGISKQILMTANTYSGEKYIFGGTRQDAPPYDPATAAPASIPTSPAMLRLEPNSQPISIGVTGETVFADGNGTIFDTLTAAATALRGTGDPAADRAALQTAMTRLNEFSELGSAARAQIGVDLQTVEVTGERLAQDVLLLETRIQQIEAADLAEAALQFTETERSLEATLQVSARVSGRRTLIDLLG